MTTLKLPFEIKDIPTLTYTNIEVVEGQPYKDTVLEYINAHMDEGNPWLGVGVDFSKMATVDEQREFVTLLKQQGYSQTLMQWPGASSPFTGLAIYRHPKESSGAQEIV